jgi:hypothetical protein
LLNKSERWLMAKLMNEKYKLLYKRIGGSRNGQFIALICVFSNF